METVYSKLGGGILHKVIRKSDAVLGRQDFVNNEEFLQVSQIQSDRNRQFPAHIHLRKVTTYEAHVAQESWVVIQGRVLVRFFDIDHTLLQTFILRAGDICITLYGGHSYEIIEDDTIVYEFKTGPYEGQTKDKEFI